MTMKCQRCSRKATHHITDLDRGKVHEFHLCEECATKHLTASETADDGPSMSQLAQKLSLPAGGAGSKTGEPGSNKPVCPVCGLTFGEFRQTGRLGCPHDYEAFRDELMPLLDNIHGESRHAGKAPRRSPRGTQHHTKIIHLRKEMKQAIVEEDYETAAKLRDQIKVLEGEAGLRRASEQAR